MIVQHQLEASILAAPLAATDRRALSQAWYSALHLARDSQPALPTDAVSGVAVTASGSPGTAGEMQPRVAGSGLRATPAQTRATSGRAQDRSIAEIVPDRRTAHSRLAREIVHTFLNARSNSKRASFSIGRDAGRVHVILQNKNGRTALLAVCAPAQRDAVRRALEHARFALAARHIAIAFDGDAGVRSCF